MSDEAGSSDIDLATRVAHGDQGALAQLFDRHAHALHDFAARLMGERDAAQDVVQVTYIKLWDSLQSDHASITNVRGWLFAVARNAALDELRKRKRSVVTADDDWLDYAVLDPGRLPESEDRVRSQELASLVWEAAAALNPDDRALLDLHLRQDLSADELSELLGLRKGAVYTRLSRLKDALEESVVALQLSRHGRRDCRTLDGLLTGLGPDAAARRIRKAIRAHLPDCDNCQAAKRRLVSPVSLFGSLAPIPLASETKAAIWDTIHRNIDERKGGGPPSSTPRRRFGTRRAKAVVVTAIVAAVLVSTITPLVLAGASNVPGVHDPSDARSLNHQIGVPSIDDHVVMAWTQDPSATGYAILWSTDRTAEPPTQQELPGAATGTTSPALDPGAWWFILRTRGHDRDDWTHTLRRGPFVIVANTGTSSTTTAPSSTTSTTAASTTTNPVSTTTSRPSTTTTTTPATTATVRTTTTTVRPTTTTSASITVSIQATCRQNGSSGLVIAFVANTAPPQPGANYYAQISGNPQVNGNPYQSGNLDSSGRAQGTWQPSGPGGGYAVSIVVATHQGPKQAQATTTCP